MASTDLHVNGPALMHLSVNGGSSFNELGYSEDGVQVEMIEHEEDIYSDLLGPAVPHDVAYLGETAMIRVNFIAWDRTQMNLVESRMRSGKDPGAVPFDHIGTLMFAGSKFVSIRYGSSVRDGLSAEPFRQFLNCTVQGAIPMKVGTRVTRMQVVFRAIPRDEVLYTLVAG